MMKNFLAHLPKQIPQPITIFAFEIKLLTELGMKPDFAKTELSAGSKQILQKLLELDWPHLSRLKLSESQSAEIQNFLNVFLISHLGKIPKGRDGIFPLLQF